MADEKTYKISISPKAAEHVKKQFIKRGTLNSYLRLGVKGGGCSGYKYILKFEDQLPENSKDLIFESEGINLVVDIKSIIYLNGVVLDWEDTLINHGFKFLNPSEKSRCGCKSSFSV